MNRNMRLFSAALALSLFAGVCLPGVRAQEVNQSAQDKEVCIRNLKQIYEAIQAYRRDHKDLPNWLSDLVPQYLKEPATLVCPARLPTKLRSASRLPRGRRQLFGAPSSGSARSIFPAFRMPCSR